MEVGLLDRLKHAHRRGSQEVEEHRGPERAYEADTEGGGRVYRYSPDEERGAPAAGAREPCDHRAACHGRGRDRSCEDTGDPRGVAPGQREEIRRPGIETPTREQSEG